MLAVYFFRSAFYFLQNIGSLLLAITSLNYFVVPNSRATSDMILIAIGHGPWELPAR